MSRTVRRSAAIGYDLKICTGTAEKLILLCASHNEQKGLWNSLLQGRRCFLRNRLSVPERAYTWRAESPSSASPGAKVIQMIGVCPHWWLATNFVIFASTCTPARASSFAVRKVVRISLQCSTFYESAFRLARKLDITYRCWEATTNTEGLSMQCSHGNPWNTHKNNLDAHRFLIALRQRKVRLRKAYVT